MLNAAKIQFSKEELSLLQNAQIILTKNDIMQKVVVMFSDLALAVFRGGSNIAGCPG